MRKMKIPPCPMEMNEQDRYFLRQTYEYEAGRRNSMTDAEWDTYAYQNEARLKAMIPDFDPYTGMWIRRVPRLWYTLSGASWRHEQGL